MLGHQLERQRGHSMKLHRVGNVENKTSVVAVNKPNGRTVPKSHNDGFRETVESGIAACQCPVDRMMKTGILACPRNAGCGGLVLINISGGYPNLAARLRGNLSA